MIFILFIAFIIILFIVIQNNQNYQKDITQLTDLWIYNVTVLKNPVSISNMFCNDAVLIGTVSQIIRKGEDIRKYFDYFAKIPGLRVNKKTYDIQEIDNDTIINNAWIEWNWDGLDEPIMARMSFIFRKDIIGNYCLFELHSSKLPEKSEDLVKISGKN